MLKLGLLFSLLAAAPAVAGTVAAYSFSEKLESETVVGHGVSASMRSGFVVYQHGAWGETGSDRASVDFPVVPQNGVVEPQLALDAGSDSCGARPLPDRRGLSARAVAGRLTYWPLVRDAECRHRLPAGLLDALVIQESRYQSAAVSPAKAAGLSQLMPKTAIDLGVLDRFDPVANIDGGARYLRRMLDRYHSIPSALAAYNAGPGSVDRAKGIPQNSETPGYVVRVLSFWNQHTQPRQLVHEPGPVATATSIVF